MIFRARTPGATVNLALQGGGAHGAFTWGVLDLLLEDGRLEFEAISATSAGAMNAVALAHGWLEKGREGARAALERLWNATAAAMPLSATVAGTDGQSVALAPSFKRLLRWADYFAPDSLNPFDRNPMREILSEQIDFARLRSHSQMQLFIAATNARSGKLRLFRTPELSVDAVLASACLPMMNRAVEIDGQSYWDGGYCANPAVFPLLAECRSPDILLVLLSPLQYKDVPRSVDEIKERALEISFTASFLREMHLIAQFRDDVRSSRFAMGRVERRIAQANFHLIDAQEFMSDLAPETKLAANIQFFGVLKDLGREHARTWLDKHWADLGRRSSVNLNELFC